MDLAPAESTALPRKSGAGDVSTFIRRVHLYTGLFLAPWMLMYAFSTLVMTHRELVKSLYPASNAEWVQERQMEYSRSFEPSASRQEIAQTILKDLSLDGSYSVSGGKNGKPIVITRLHAVGPRRISFDAAKQAIVIQREPFQLTSFLERMHRRRGYNSYPLENSWGFSVDTAVVAMMFWAVSGLWLWWELKPTRLWGGLACAAGIALFTLLALMI